MQPGRPERALVLIDNRSAAGAAWQSSFGGVDAERDRLVHFNQGCGDSDQNWGFESSYALGPQVGIVQKQWIPLLSNDYKQPGTPSGKEISHQPFTDSHPSRYRPPHPAW
jgi:hypothetical protein